MIIAAAIQIGSLTLTMPAPNRHHNIINEYYRITGKKFDADLPHEQGFITNEGLFVGRAEAVGIALAHNQVLNGKLMSPPYLFSEDLW